jgi:hypothetical protein
VVVLPRSRVKLTHADLTLIPHLERAVRGKLGVGDDVVGVDVDLEREGVAYAKADVALLHVDARFGRQTGYVNVNVALLGE